MRINTRLAVAIHIMTAIELFSVTGAASTSELLAKSVNTNPVVIRRIIGMLKKAGLVEVKAGVGGASLRRKPADITWLDVYNAVKDGEDASLFHMHENPQRRCYIGKYMHEVLENPLLAAQQAMEDKLATFTLLDTIAPIAEKNSIELK